MRINLKIVAPLVIFATPSIAHAAHHGACSRISPAKLVAQHLGRFRAYAVGPTYDLSVDIVAMGEYRWVGFMDAGVLAVVGCKGNLVWVGPSGSQIQAIKPGPPLPDRELSVQVRYDLEQGSGLLYEQEALLVVRGSDVEAAWYHDIHDVLEGWTPKGYDYRFRWRYDRRKREIQVSGSSEDDDASTPSTRRLSAETYCWDAKAERFQDCTTAKGKRARPEHFDFAAVIENALRNHREVPIPPELRSVRKAPPK